MRATLRILAVAVALVGCGSPQAQPSPVATKESIPRVTRTAPLRHPTEPARPVVASAAYQHFLRAICGALSRGDADTIRNSLPYYQYNSGLRYGLLGDGEGRTGDPSLLNTWLAGAHVQCRAYTPDAVGHGTLLASGWKQLSGGWGLMELDTFSGNWKINDFTFGSEGSLAQAMKTAHPILVYRG